MNFKTTIALALLVAGGGAAWFFLSARPTEKPSDTLTVLEKELKPDQLTRIEIKRGTREVVLSRPAGGEWSLRGNWRVRKPEVKQLVTTLTTLRSRFEPIPLGTPPNLKPYGLDRDPLVVQVKAGGKDYKLTFGEKADETNHFSQATYLRLGDKSEVVRLAPNLVGALDRPQDYYQQRRLFPAERVAKDGSPNEKVEQLVAKEVEVTSGGTGYKLTKTDRGWRLRDLAGVIDDRADPEKLKKIEAALPDVWAERFVAPGEKTTKEMGLDKPEQTVRVTPIGGDTLELQVGAVARVTPRRVQKPAPPFGGPPMKPQEMVVFEEYRYAQLKGNNQVFEVRGDRLKEVAVAAAELRDPQLAHFRAADARRVEIDEGGRQLVFVLDKDNQRWRMTQPSAVDAEPGKVTELLDKLSGLEARDKDVIDKDDPKTQGFDKPAAVKIALEEKDGDKGTKKRELTFLLGKETDKDRLYVKVAGERRVNKVDDAVLKLVRRPALAYRNRRVLDVPTSEIAKIEVKRPAESLTLKQVKGAWKLVAPVQANADSGKAEQLAGEAARLEAAEFVAEKASPEDLDKLYGLAKPDVTVHVTFTDAKKPARTLTLGKQLPGKQEFFARLDGDPTIFAVKKELRDVLQRDSLAYRPLELWRMPAADVAEIRVQKTEPEYRLQREGEGWKVSGPFDAIVAEAQVRPITEALADLRAQKYVTHGTKKLEQYGLDKPYLRIAVREAAPKEEKKDAKGEKKDAKEHILLIGGKADKDGRYAKLGGGEAVFVLPEKVVAAVDRGALDFLDRKLLSLDEGRIQRVRTTHADGKTFTLERQKDAWRVVQAPPVSFAPDAEALDDSLRVWSNLRAARFAAYGPKIDEAEFGLAKPAVTIRVTVQEPGEKDKPGKTSEHTLLLGKAVEGGKGTRYARLDKGPGVVVLDAQEVRDLDRTHLDFVSRRVFNLDADKITAIKRVAGGDTLEIVKKDDNWRLLKPADAAADGPTLATLARVLADLRAVRVAAYPAGDLARFGLEKPVAVLTVTVSGADGKPAAHVLNIGAPADSKDDPKGGQRYARVGKSDTVVVVRTRQAVDLRAPALHFRDRNLARVAAPDRVVLERDGRKLTFAQVNDTWKLTEPVDADAESAELEAFVKQLTRLRPDELVANRAIDPKTYGLDRPRARWRLLAGGKELLTLFVGAAEKNQDNKAGPRAYAKLGSGELIFLLDPAQSDKALAEYRSRKPWPALDAVQIDRLTFGYAKDSFTLQKVGMDWLFVGKPGGKANAEAVRDVLDALASLQAQRYAADRGADLKLYGLEPPVLALEIQTPTGKRTLKIGRQEGESARRYAAVPELPGTVFVLSDGLARRVVRPLQAFTAAK